MADYADILSFYEGLLRAVNTKSTDYVTREYIIAGNPIVIHFIGIQQLPFFTLSLAHLETARTAKTDAFTMYVVDASVAKIKLPTLFWRPGDVSDYDGAIRVMPDGIFAACISEYQTIQFIDHTAKIGFVWMNNTAILQEWESSFPFRTFFYQLLKEQGFLFIHAGAVGTSQGGVLLTGKGGAGKSTTCLSSILYSNLQYAGDDFICINPQTRMAYSLYNIAKLTNSNISRFPELASNSDGVDGDKLQYFVHKHLPQKMIKQMKVKAIFIPNYSPSHTIVSLSIANKQDVMKALAPSSVLLLRAGEKEIKKLALLIGDLPSYWINTNENLIEIASVIENYLKEND